MFYGSDNGGRTAAVLSSVIATSKRFGIDPFAYLRDLFKRLSRHPQSRLAELLPDQWKSAHVKVDGKEGG
jgi:transposase